MIAVQAWLSYFYNMFIGKTRGKPVMSPALLRRQQLWSWRAGTFDDAFGLHRSARKKGATVALSKKRRAEREEKNR
jgi:hypothetical protein